MSSQRAFLSRFLIWLITGLRFLCQAVLIAWATLAIYYSNLPWPWPRLVMAGVFASFAIWALFLSRQRRMSVAVAELLRHLKGLGLSTRMAAVGGDVVIQIRKGK